MSPVAESSELEIWERRGLERNPAESSGAEEGVAKTGRSGLEPELDAVLMST